MKNFCGARVGDIWSLGVEGWHYLLLDVKTPSYRSADEDTFYAIRLHDGYRDEVYFSHHEQMGWVKVA